VCDCARINPWRINAAAPPRPPRLVRQRAGQLHADQRGCASLAVNWALARRADEAVNWASLGGPSMSQLGICSAGRRCPEREPEAYRRRVCSGGIVEGIFERPRAGQLHSSGPTQRRHDNPFNSRPPFLPIGCLSGNRVQLAITTKRDMCVHGSLYMLIYMYIYMLIYPGFSLSFPPY
jgi:hypothetical protein